MGVGVHVGGCACVRACMRARVCVCVCARACVCACARACVRCMDVCMCMCLCVRACVRVCICVWRYCEARVHVTSQRRCAPGASVGGDGRSPVNNCDCKTYLQNSSTCLYLELL